MKKLFLSHHSTDAAEVSQLGRALRHRGIAPWIDKQGGFRIGDDSPEEARRAIAADCFGCLLYATRLAFARPFITKVELPSAISAKERDPSYLLFAVPRRLDFHDLRDLSQTSIGVNLAQYHTRARSRGEGVEDWLAAVGDEVLGKRVTAAAGSAAADGLSIQFGTRELMPDEPDDLLRIDACPEFARGVDRPDEWARLHAALTQVERAIGQTFGRPRLRLHGSRHLTGGFLFGRAFSRYDLAIRQTPTSTWETDAAPDDQWRFEAAYTAGAENDGNLLVTIRTRHKDVARDALGWWRAGPGGAPSQLDLRPVCEPMDVSTSAQCRSLADQAYEHIEHALQAHKTTQLHLFVAAPISMMMMLGRRFAGTPPACCYEWTGGTYVRTLVEANPVTDGCDSSR